MKTIISAAALALISSSVSAHTIFQVRYMTSMAALITNAILQELYVNGVDQGHLTGIRVPDYDGVSATPFPNIEAQLSRIFAHPAHHGCHFQRYVVSQVD